MDGLHSMKLLGSTGLEIHEEWEELTKEYRKYWRLERRALLVAGVPAWYLAYRKYQYMYRKLRWYHLWLPKMTVLTKEEASNFKP